MANPDEIFEFKNCQFEFRNCSTRAQAFEAGRWRSAGERVTGASSGSVVPLKM